MEDVCEFVEDCIESIESVDSKSDEIEGRVRVYGPGAYRWDLNVHRSYFLKDILLDGGQIDLLWAGEYEFFVCDDVTLDWGEPVNPCTIVFIGQSVIIRNHKWYWGFRVINSIGSPKYYESGLTYSHAPIADALEYVNQGAAWVEIVKSHTPLIPNTTIVYYHWWKDPPDDLIITGGITLALFNNEDVIEY